MCRTQRMPRGRHARQASLQRRCNEAKLKRMTIELKPETELLLREEIRNGRVVSVDELIVFGVRAVREQSKAAGLSPQPPRKRLYDLLTQPPFAGSELDLERVKDFPRSVDL